MFLRIDSYCAIHQNVIVKMRKCGLTLVVYNRPPFAHFIRCPWDNKDWYGLFQRNLTYVRQFKVFSYLRTQQLLRWRSVDNHREMSYTRTHLAFRSRGQVCTENTFLAGSRVLFRLSAVTSRLKIQWGPMILQSNNNGIRTLFPFFSIFILVHNIDKPPCFCRIDQSRLICVI